jgi:hypothetical protein
MRPHHSRPIRLLVSAAVLFAVFAAFLAHAVLSDPPRRDAIARPSSAVVGGRTSPSLASAEAQTGIHGRVVHVDGSAAVGATVRLIDQDGESVAGADGRFTLAAPRGVHLIEAQTAEEAGGPLTIAVADAGADTTIILRRGTVAEVIVRDLASSQPIANARVALTAMTPLVPSGEPALLRSTDAEGRVAFAAIPTAQGSITVTAAGYAPVHVPITPALLVGNRRHVTVLLQRGLVVRGRVVDPRGAPVSGASVFVSSSAGTIGLQPDELASAVTADGRGEFELHGRSPFYVKAVASGFLPAVSKLVPATQNSDVEDVVLALASGARITGTVVDAAGAPVASARVTAVVPPRSGAIATTITGADGGFAFDHLPAGAELAAEAGDRTSAPVRMTDDEHTAKLVLDRDGSITGSVISASGEPIPGAIVQCTPVLAGSAGQTIAALPASATRLAVATSDGTFACHGLESSVPPPPDTSPETLASLSPTTVYRVQARLPDVGTLVMSDAVLVAPGDSATVAFAATGKIVGRIAGATSPIVAQLDSGVRIPVDPGSGSLLLADVAPGHHVVRVIADQRHTAISVEVKSSETTDLGTVAAP